MIRDVRVRGAREHNLKGVDVDTPRDVLAVFTGVSGSGKSSWRSARSYAEAQRRYFESVAPYARRLDPPGGGPKVGEITGLPPAVSLQQAPRGPHLAFLGGHGHQPLQLAAHAVLPAPAATRPAPNGSTRTRSRRTPRPVPRPACHGLGQVHDTTEDLLVPDPSLSVREGAVAAWPGAWQGKNLRDILDTLGYDVDRPWRELPRRTAGVDPVHRRAAGQSPCTRSGTPTASNGRTGARTRAPAGMC